MRGVIPASLHLLETQEVTPMQLDNAHKLTIAMVFLSLR